MRSQGILQVLGGAALGAAAMYVLDPQAGAYRRHRLVEQTKPLRNEGSRLIESARHRASRGVQFVQQHLGKAGRSVRSLPRLAPTRYLEHAGSSLAGHTGSLGHDLGQRLSSGWDYLRERLGFRPRRSAISQYGTSATAVIGAACASCTAMYLLDPVSGRRRRAWIADKARSLLNEVGDAVDVTWRDTTNRLRGLWTRVGSIFDRRQPTDEQITQRVRAQMGRLVWRPRQIEVSVQGGRVFLSGGPLSPGQCQRLIEHVQSMRGVTAVENQLRLEPAPSSEGGYRQSEWGPAPRVASSVAGVGLLACGLVRRDGLGLAAAALGLGLATRAATNVSVRGVAAQAVHKVRSAVSHRQDQPAGV